MISFSTVLPTLPIKRIVQQSYDKSKQSIELLLKNDRVKSLSDLAALITPTATEFLEILAKRSQRLTQHHFGKTIRLFAPLYLSNECVNICRYCGFSRNNPIPRITIPVEQVVRETHTLAQQGFRSLLLVAGEHPKYVSNGYVETCIKRCLPHMPSIALELGPMETDAYRPLVKAGAEGLVVYQETYDPDNYKKLHTAGPKKNYSWRLDASERAYAGGFRRMGIGVLLGLSDWRAEVISLAAHTAYLLKHCWRAQINISLLRLRPAAGAFQPNPLYSVSDKDLVQIICALRLYLPTAGITLSTREQPSLRDNLIPLGITTMSAGSSTEPGGYSHYDQKTWTPMQKQEGEQFHISDERSPAAISTVIDDKGYEPVWKDFDQSLAG